jgi:hypothetical protein
MSPARVDADWVAVDEAFAVLVCDDPELLDAEFEAIMTANGFDAEPPAPCLPLQGNAGDDDRRPTPRNDAGLPWASAVTAHMHRRQRSPP